jgi:catechol 2,3-dioxygenase-like lactoylglutathione lyase family enzyme
MTTRLLYATVVAPDLPATLAFYDAVLAALGLGRHSEFSDEEEDGLPADAVGYGEAGEQAILWVVAGEQPTTAVHLALRGDDRGQVEAFFAAAVPAGGTGHQAPRRWEIYRRGYVGATVADPRGNLIEAVAPE